MNLNLIEITSNDSQLLDDFLKNAGEETLKTFRYFNKRPKEVIDNHLITYILVDQELKLPVAYGHLDRETTKTWLGIAVSESFQGKGIGKMMMNHLLAYASSSKIEEIYLSVDKTNTPAISLYKSCGFTLVSEHEHYYEFKNKLG